jgi:hypothetical protein
VLTSRQKRSQVYPKEDIGLFQVLTKLKNLTDGWIAAYSFTDCDSQMEELDLVINIVFVQIFKDFGLALRRNDLYRSIVEEPT